MTDHKVTQHVLEKKRQNRRQIIWSVALAAITVLCMTYYDLKFKSYAIGEVVDIEFHYVRNDADITRLPDDSSAVTVWQGTLTPQPNGNVIRQDAPVTPVNLPQRQINLSFGMASLPENAYPAMIKEIGASLRAWESKNNLVMDAELDTSALNDVPADALAAFMKQLHDAYSEQYRYTLVFDPLDSNDLVVRLDDTTRKSLMENFTGGLGIRVTPDTATQAIAAADKLGYRFFVAIPAGTDINTFETDAAAKAKHFTHFIRDATPQASEGP